MQFSTQIRCSLIATLFAISSVTGQGTSSMCEPTVPAYNAPCRISVDQCTDIFVTGSFTYWQPVQENMQLGVVSDTTDPLDLVNGKEIDLDYDFKPGFKVGMGMNFDYDNWDTFFQYTWFRGTERVSVDLDPANTEVNLLPAWQIPEFLNPQYNVGSEKWKLRIDLFDLDLARSYYVGTKLCFRPFVGVRGAIIDQKVNVDYVNVTPSDLFIWPSTSVVQTSNSWGIGPRVGLSSNWNFCGGWRFYGNGELDILFTQYDVKSTQTSDVTVANRFIVRQHDLNYLRTHVELELGLGWGQYLSCNRYHLDFSAGYGFQVFFDQNMFRNTFSAQGVGKGTMPNGNLYIQGLTATVRFDF
jgi:hypothetical protein